MVPCLSADYRRTNSNVNDQSNLSIWSHVKFPPFLNVHATDVCREEKKGKKCVKFLQIRSLHNAEIKIGDYSSSG